jgi:hypothetical protein
LGDAHYSALQINIDGFTSPYVLTLAMPAIGFRALSEQVDPLDLYDAIARAIGTAAITVDVQRRRGRKSGLMAAAA